jgi:hypothetical protein
MYILATMTAVAAAGLLLYGVLRAEIASSFDAAVLSEITATANAALSGLFGFLAKELRRQQARLDAEERREAALQNLTFYVLMIEDSKLRNKTVADVSKLLAAHLYGGQTEPHETE